MRIIDPTPYLDKFPKGSEIRSFNMPEGIEGEAAIGICIPMMTEDGIKEQYLFMCEMNVLEEYMDFQKSKTLILGFHSGFVPVFSIGALGVEDRKEESNNAQLPGDPSTN